MRIGWLADVVREPGGAELTQAEFRAAAPNGVEITDCPAGEIDDTCDLYVIHNCVKYTVDDLRLLNLKPVVKYWHDVGPWLQPGVYDWIAKHANRQICCSPIQADHMALDDAIHIPPPVDLDRFTRVAESVNGNRAGAVCVASWRNAGKGQRKVMEWAAENDGIDFFGGGHLAPPGSRDVPYDAMATLLATYKTFVFLPTVIEPFGRLVAEAWAAGCEIITNQLVGARYWIEEDPGAIETAAATFWQEVLR